MCKLMYNREQYALLKNVKPSHFHDVIEKEVFESYSKKIILLFRKC